MLHLSGIDELAFDGVKELLRRVPALKIMQAIPVRDEEAIAQAKQFAPICESILLDTPMEGVKIGATGRTHDWSISARIVEAIDKPVVLAGGLNVENGGAAIQAVKPWGVDSFTLTSYADNLQRKDLDKVRDFIRAAKQPA